MKMDLDGNRSSPKVTRSGRIPSSPSSSLSLSPSSPRAQQPSLPRDDASAQQPSVSTFTEKQSMAVRVCKFVSSLCS